MTSQTPYVSDQSIAPTVNLGTEGVPTNIVRNGSPGDIPLTQPPVETPTQLVGGGKKTYKGRTYVVRIGKRGGKYITVKGKKIYV